MLFSPIVLAGWQGMETEIPHRSHRRRSRKVRKAKRWARKALFWVVLPVLGILVLMKTVQFYFGVQ